MKAIKFLIELLREAGLTLGMWLRGMWFCIALCICNPSDDTPLWFVFALIAHVFVAGLAVAGDRKKWKDMCDHLSAE
jgi:hypothetical protein